MRKLLPLLALAFFDLAGARAAITVAPGGSGVISFSALPSATEWSTRSLAGNELTFTTAAALDAAVQTNSATTITNALLDGLGAVPPGQNTLASWSGGGTTALWTRPAANSATLLMATLQNSTGEDQTVAKISYTLAQSATTPAEQAAAHQVYYSLTGAPGSWVKIPALSGGTAGARSQLISLNGIWVNGAPLYILWADDNTTGGVDRGWSLDEVSFTGRPPLVLEIIPDFRTDVLQPVVFQTAVSNAPPGARLVYSLDPGAPAGARVRPTNGLFAWRPARADAGTTNFITLRVTDADVPASGTTRTFVVAVNDCVELSLGHAFIRTILPAGARTNVPFETRASVPLTNLQVTMLLPTNRLTAPTVDNLAPATVALAVDDAQPGRVALSFAALPGQFIVGTQILARLHFTAAPEPASAFVPLLLDSVTVARALPGLAPSLLLNHGRAAVVNREPMLEVLDDPGSRSLLLYGRPGTNYAVETATSAAGPWQFFNMFEPQSLLTFIEGGDTNPPVTFYRAYENFSVPAAPAPADTGVTAPGKPATVKKIKKPKKKRISAARRASPAIVVPQ